MQQKQLLSFLFVSYIAFFRVCTVKLKAILLTQFSNHFVNKRRVVLFLLTTALHNKLGLKLLFNISNCPLNIDNGKEC